MNTHLSREQIIQRLIGDGTSMEIQHLEECSQCVEELQHMQEGLADFRSSLRNWADHSGPQPRPAFLSERTAMASSRRILRWSLVSAALASAVVIPIYRQSVERQRAALAEEDTLLLEEVNAQLSRVVPASIEPLVELLPDDDAKNEGDRR